MPTTASTHASRGMPRIAMTAPTNGMNTGALAGIPCCFMAIACPISCTKSNSTNPSANGNPQSVA